MEGRNANNDLPSTNTFEYTFPICDETEEENVDSNKSTPYYTPLEYCTSSFEFPSPKPIEKQEDLEKVKSLTTTTTAATTNQESMNFVRQISQSSVKQAPTATSPAVSRKLRRFSLYERRSLSPQQLLTKNIAGSVDLVTIKSPSPVNDKENAMPTQLLDQRIDENLQQQIQVSKSGNNSPIILKDESGSPKFFTTDGVSRHNFSPKLLASINNLKLANSPLGIISSAGYKNGNYFKFPEIDNVVQEQQQQQIESGNEFGDNQTTTTTTTSRNISKQNSGANTATASTNKSRFISSSLDIGGGSSNIETIEAAARSPITKIENVRKNRKNKNNLTIKITDALATSEAAAAAIGIPSPSPSPKPKTPTIKNTKEKALSLDSAATCETALSIVIQSDNEPTHVSCDEIDSKAQFPIGACSGSSGGGLGVNSLQLRQRNQPAINRDRLRPSMSAATSKQSICSTSSSPAGYRSAGHKPSPLLHSSNTNLKTLPEFLTLVEFSNTSPKEREQYPYKQKSMDLPSSSSNVATTPVQRSKIANSSSGTLLQRRNSNHSLTLNLHNSCSNLEGSCCAGLSVSNYSLESVPNSSSNVIQQAPEVVLATNELQLTSQGHKQSLFRRRCSNQSLPSRNSTTTSCGNLNTFVSQNSLLHMPGGGGSGVTRTTSFITPTQNTASNAQTPKRGLLERRKSNQSLTLNMGSHDASFGGIGGGGGACNKQIMIDQTVSKLPAACCAQHHKKFFSSENLNKPNTQFSELNDNRPFGSASDLKVSGFMGVGIGVGAASSTTASPSKQTANEKCGGGGVGGRGRGELSIDIDDNENVCTCNVRKNIMTRPLSPQRKTEEFKIYLANIQMLQNASNTLKQNDLIKLNYIFDNSYATNNIKSSSLQEVLPIVLSVDPSGISGGGSKSGTPTSANSTNNVGSGGGSLLTTSEDSEIAKRYETAVRNILDNLRIDIEQQKRIFCDLHKEFWDLPLNHQEKPLVFGSQTKNRYKTILPNETTRVMLQNEKLQLKKLEGETSAASAAAGLDTVEKISSNEVGNKLLIASTETPYINANYIKGPDANTFSYVATQGPLPNTIFEFWLMVFQNIQNQKPESAEYSNFKNVKRAGAGGGGDGIPQQQLQYYQKIVMLTNFLEQQRQKCAIYFPIELNEIFIAANNHENVPNNEHLTAFFEEYLQKTETTAACGEDAIEEFELQELNDEVRSSLPKTGNIFVIKNVGIVRKNGFSIRKMIGLYCFIKPQRGGGGGAGGTGALGSDESNIEILIKRFCCFHYWYPDWPDHRSPRDINTLLDISLHILNLGKCESEFETPSSSPLSLMPKSHLMAQHIELYQHDMFNAVQPFPIIHCSAGVGRTGCLTAILNGIRQMRQSLAYSLTSMAADVSKSINTNLTIQPLSPIDFRLPTEFFDALPTTKDNDENNFQLECNNDTDSSFTRNTLLYIRFIAEKYKESKQQQQQEEEIEIETTNDDDETLLRHQDHHHHYQQQQQIFNLTDLPRMPDIIVDILGIVCNLRLSRGGMVQNSEQYELIHRALCLYLKRTFALKRF